MATIASLLVVMGMDTTGLSAGAAKANAGLAGVGASAKAQLGAVVPLAAAAGGAAVVKFAIDAVGAASATVEATNKVNVVFGQQADQIHAWSETTAEAFGISKLEALEAAGTMGNLFDAMGLAGDAGAEMSMTLVELASDLASFNDADPSDVLAAMQSGLTGQIRPLRQYGIEISEAAIKQEALAQGITKSTTEMTLAEKVALRYKLILDQTGNAQGDFARTSDDLANSQRRLSAHWDNFQAQLGMVLIPLVEGFVHALSELATVLTFVASGFEDFNKEVQDASVNLAEAEVRAGAWVLQFVKGVPILGEAIKVTEALTAESRENSNVLVDLEGHFRGVAERAMALGQEYVKTGGYAKDLRNETKALEAAQRELRMEMLAATNSFLSLQLAADDVSEAQRELNRLERQGKEDTQAYDAAVIDAVQSQLALESAVVSYAQELVDSGSKQKDVERKVKELAEGFGIQGSVVGDLIARIREYINQLNGIPSNVTTTLTTRHITQGGTGPGLQLAHGGIVTRPTVALIGEAGPEAVIPLDKAGGGGGDVVLQIDGQTFARISRDQLLKLKGSRASLGLS